MKLLMPNLNFFKSLVSTSIVSNKSVQDKGKRKIAKCAEVEKSYKFKEDPLVDIVALEIDVKK